MSVRFVGARAVGAVSTAILKTVFRRPAGNFPGKIGLRIDPQLISHLRPKILKGSIVVVGTNGKTTVTNMIADCLEASGQSVACNRLGANLAYGVATTLLQSSEVDWAVIESDELWLGKTLPQLRSTYVVLLNLFRDQLDRCGEIDHIQDVIIEALTSSPESTLIFNADDPQCAAIAAQVPNRSVPFGIAQSMGLQQNTVLDAQMCQMCEGMLSYDFRQYGQLGSYRCPDCGFERPALAAEVSGVSLAEEGSSFTLHGENWAWNLTTPFGGAYMVYNVSAVAVAAALAGCSQDVVQGCISKFSPDNGRLQYLTVAGRKVLLNLAKNPTGFNQNLKIVTQGEGPRVVAFFINDKEADGHDVSWLWDIDFEELAACEGLVAFAGGIRAHDMQVRLKYAGINARITQGAEDLFEQIKHLPLDAKVYLIANYTALPEVKNGVERLSKMAVAPVGDKSEMTGVETRVIPACSVGNEKPLVIAHLFPELLNLYGDGGNVTILRKRLEWRGIPVEVRQVRHGQTVDLSQVDLVFLGGGPDREQRLASRALLDMADELRSFAEDDGTILAICGGYQILGTTWLLGEEEVPGLGILDIRTGRAAGGSTNRLIENIALQSGFAQDPVVGYENHAGRTYLGDEATPFGSVISATGHGNNDDDAADGACRKNVIGTYLHGPLLAKNPQIADRLLRSALGRWSQRVGEPLPDLTPLDDAEERAANAAMCRRIVR